MAVALKRKPLKLRMPEPLERDILRFQAAARAYLQRRGRYDEDILSEMVLHA